MAYTALVLPVLIGFSGLSVDVGVWYTHKRQVQAAADAAALAGALEALRTGTSAQVRAAAELDAGTNGFDLEAGDLLTVNYPVAYGSVTDAVEVIIRRPAPTFLSEVFLDGPVTIIGRAVATAGINDTCVWVLNPDEKSAVKVAGGAEVELGCGLMVNSSHPDALTQNGAGSCITASRITIAGGYSGTCVWPSPVTYATQVGDPLASLEPPTYGACDHEDKTKPKKGETVTLSPGVYCDDIEAVSGASITFEPGLYVLDDAGLKFNAQSTVVGEGVTFYFTENMGWNDISIAGQSSVTLKAASGGELPGVLFYVDRNAAEGVKHTFSGGSTTTLEGIMYFPKHEIKFTGGSTLDNAAVLIIADVLSFTGNSYVGNYENTAVESNPAIRSANIVE